MKKFTLNLIYFLFLFSVLISSAIAFTETNIVENSRIAQPNSSSFVTDSSNASVYIISLYRKVFYGLDTSISPAIQLFLKNSNGQIIFIGTLSEGFFKRYLIKPGHYELIAVFPSVIKNVEHQISTYAYPSKLNEIIFLGNSFLLIQQIKTLVFLILNQKPACFM